MAKSWRYFFAERYRGLAVIDRLPAPLDTELRRDLQALAERAEHPRSSPDEFSQELLFSVDGETRAKYLTREVVFPFYSRVGDDKFWRCLRSQTNYVDRLRDQCPQLDTSLIEQLWLERSAGMHWALPSPSEQKARWRSVGRYAPAGPTIGASDGRYGCVVVAPRWGIGGSEKVMRELVASIERLTGQPSLIVVADTEVDPAVLPQDVVCLANVELREEAFIRAPIPTRMSALADLILAIGAPRLISINSFIGNALLQDGAPQRAGIATAAAMFCIALGPGGAVEGYIQIADWLIDAGVTLFTDNDHMARMLAAENFYEGTVVLPAPVAVAEEAVAGGDRVLWAGRIDGQKRPDLLLEISRLSPDLTYEVWGVPVLSTDSIMGEIKGQPNIDYRGGFDGFDSIDKSRVGCLLYTSGYDGTPNVLLEAMACGLPCVCSAVGGIPDLMAEGRGVLAPADAPAEAYVAALRALLGDAELRGASARRAREHVREAHSVQAFDRAVAGLLQAM